MVTEAKTLSLMFFTIFSITFIIIPIWFVFRGPFIPTLFLIFLIFYSFAGYKISIFLLNPFLNQEVKFPTVQFRKFFYDNISNLERLTMSKFLGLIFLLIYLLLFIPSLTTPIKPRGDTGMHAWRSILIIDALRKIFLFLGINLSFIQINLLFTSLFLGLCSIGSFLFLINKRLSAIKEFTRSPTFPKVLLLSIISLYSMYIVFSLFFSIVTEMRMALSLIRYGPVSGYIFNIPNIFFPITELNFRILNLLLSFGCMLFLYKIIRLFFTKEVSIFGSISIFVTPVVFGYVYLEYLLIGFLLLQFASFYYFLLYLKKKKSYHLSISYTLTLIAIFYKDPLILLIPLYMFIGLVYSYHQTRNSHSRFLINKFYQEFKFFLVPSIICVFYYIPWYFIYNTFVRRSYNFTPEFLFNLDRILMYLTATIEWLGIIFPLALGGFFIRILIKKLNVLDLLSISWYIILYLFYTFDYWPSPQSRFMIPALFFFYYNAGELINQIVTKTNDFFSKKLYKHYWSEFFVFLLLLIVLLPLIFNSYQISREEFSSTYLPFDEASIYLRDNLPSNSSILVTMGTNPYLFYDRKYDLKLDFRTDLWLLPEDQNSTNLWLFCTEENIEYVMLPSSDYIYWSSRYINKELVEMMKNDEAFIELVEFQYRNSENYLYLFQVEIN